MKLNKENEQQVEESTQLPTVEDLNNIESYNAYFYNLNNEKPGVKSDTFFAEEPRMCMQCRNTGSQINVDFVVVSGKKAFCHAVGVYACSLCKESTVHFFENKKYYFKTDEGKVGYPEILISKLTFPQDYYNIDIPINIQNKFKKFTHIYQEAQTAEEMSLLELAGMGYRKAIEFLVTDFLLEYSTNDELKSDWLTSPKTSLKKKIEKLPNERLIKTGTAIAYIGNDETHYSPQNPNYNIQDMKRFISLLIKEIESEMIYSDVEDFLG